MQLSLVALLPLLFSSTIAASITPTTPSLIFKGVHPIPTSNRIIPAPTNSTTPGGGPITISDSCYTTNLNIQRSDITALRNNLQNSNGGALTYVPALTVISWSLGTALLCVYNDYLFDNTHVSRWEAGWVTGYIQDTCFYNGGGVCQGGSATCSGDSGLSLRAVLRKSGNENC